MSKDLITEIKLVEKITGLMDDVFRIPGTNFRFGIDPLINLIPGAGAVAGYSVSALLVVGLVRNGASSKLAFRMVFNVILDALVGAIPFLGTIWDFTYKANTRNLNLMKEHYEEGKHKGSVLPLLIMIISVFVLFFIVLIVGIGFLVSYLFNIIF